MNCKIGIVTLVGNFNYGNRLQNFALQEAISNLGYTAQTLGVKNQEKIYKKTIKKILFYSSGIITKNARINNFARCIKIEKFTNKYINQSEYSLPIEKNRDIDKHFDTFIVGSDQVWNPHYNLNNNYFLNFTNKRKISYAASLGITNLPEKFENNLIQALDSFYAISVREQSAVNILQSKINKKINFVLDPTFLLTKNQWEEYISTYHLKNIEENYILLYFLGDIYEEIWRKINELSILYDAKIINLMDSQNQKYYVIDPFEFLLYIKNCTLFFTDSFHGTVFSIILNKQFVVCERSLGADGNMNTRLESLLDNFKLNNRTFTMQISMNLWTNQNFDKVNKILSIYRSESLNFLKQSLED